MTVPNCQFFSNATFFTDVRTLMDANRGMYAGRDGDWYHVCMDASFYRFEVLKRQAALTFTDAAKAQGQDVRVVVNGQMYGTRKLDYVDCMSGPCVVPWQGEILAQGTTIPGTPPSERAFRHFAEWSGRSTVAYAVGVGDPSSVSPSYLNAIGTLIPLLRNSKSASPSTLGTWQDNAGVGKAVYGIHRNAEIVFVLVQKSGAANGLDGPTLIAKLQALGVTDAAMGDGSTSVTLVVDGSLEVSPIAYKNNGIPTGLMFRLEQPLKLQPSSVLKNRTDVTSDPQFSQPFTVTGVAGDLNLTNQGAEITLASLGATPSYTASQLVAAFNTSVPLSLKTSSSWLTGGRIFVGGNVSASLSLQPTQTTDGSMMGQFTVHTPRGIVYFDVDWPLTH